MLDSRRLELQAQMDAAYAADDKAQIEALRRTIDRETLECTAHTAERLKRVERDVVEIKSGVGEIKDELAARKNRLHGARILWDALKLIAASGGGALVLKLLATMGGGN